MKYKILFVLVLLLALTGCRSSGNGQQDGKIVLRIVTESTTVDGMRSQILSIMSDYEAAHPQVNLILEELPAQGLSRQNAISQLYVDMAAGEGPDIYLLPCGDTVTVATEGYRTIQAAPLFDNVTEEMYLGSFADISEFYDADTALNKEGLVSGVMDAGLAGEGRYTLPLRYTIPVIYADREALSETVLTEDDLNAGISMIQQLVLESRNTALAAAVDANGLHRDFLFNIFEDLVDYDSYEVTIQEPVLRAYIRNANILHRWAATSPKTPHAGSFISEGAYFTESGYPLMLSRLDSALDAAAIAQALDIDLVMLPLRGVEQKLVADVTWFGAVGADCENVEIAYDFLRQFLLEDAQWELSRPRSTEGFQSGLIAEGWPVRAEGSVEYLWQNLEFQTTFYMGNDESWDERAIALKSVYLSGEEFLDLFTDVDVARYPHPVENAYSEMYYTSNNAEYVCIAQASEVCMMLQRHMELFEEDMYEKAAVDSDYGAASDGMYAGRTGLVRTVGGNGAE